MQTAQSGPSFPSRQLETFVALPVGKQASFTGHASTSADAELGRQCPRVISKLCTVLPASVQSIPSEQGRQVPLNELYLPGRQTHSVAPGREVSYVGCDGSHALQFSEPLLAACLPASQSLHLVA